MAITGKIKGINKTIKALNQFGEQGFKEIHAITDNRAKDIASDASTRAPKNLGAAGLSGTIHEEQITPLRYRINVGSEYGAFVEFGTGQQAKVPPELQKMASKFKGKSTGTFEQGLRSIKDWCINKGIPESAAYPIFMSILKKGLRPQPYLYPAWKAGIPLYLKELKTSLKILTKKFNSK